MGWRSFSKNLATQVALDKDVKKVAAKHGIPVKLPSFWSRLTTSLRQATQQVKKKGS